MKIKKGDKVEAIAGKDRGKRGNVLRTIPGSSSVSVEGLNIVKKHIRPRREGEKGQRVEIPAPLDTSKVMVVCPKCGKPSRLGYKIDGKERVRVCKRCRAEFA